MKDAHCRGGYFETGISIQLGEGEIDRGNRKGGIIQFSRLHSKARSISFITELTLRCQQRIVLQATTSPVRLCTPTLTTPNAICEIV